MSRVPDGRNDVVRGASLMLASGAVVSAMEAGVRGVSQTLHPFVIVFWREALSAFVLVAIWSAAGRPLVARRRLPLHAFRALLNGLAILAWYFALRETPLAEATALIFTSILFAVAASGVVLGERVRIVQWLAIATGLAGTALIVGPRFDLDGSERFGALVALGSAALFGAAMLTAKLTMRADGSVVSALLLALGMGVVALVAALPVWQWPAASDVPVLAAFALCNIAGQMLFLEALRAADATVIIPLDVTRLVFALAFGALFYAEWPTATGLLGAGLIAASAVAAVLYATPRNRAPVMTATLPPELAPAARSCATPVVRPAEVAPAVPFAEPGTAVEFAEPGTAMPFAEPKPVLQPDETARSG